MNEIKETIDGLLLGDGCLRVHKAKNAVYGQTGKHEEYLIYIKSLLAKYDIKFSDNSPWKHQAKKYGNIQYNITSCSNPILTYHWSRWYPNGSKIVPKDIVLSPEVMLQWYLGDGSAHTSYGEVRSIIFCTQGFSFLECQWLCEKINQLGLKASIRTSTPNKYYIGIWTKDCLNFLDYIGNCPVKCYKYKWDNIINSKTYANPQPSQLGIIGRFNA